MNSLRSTAPASFNAHGAAERSSSQEATVYSLVDFIAAPGTKTSSRRKESSEREVQGKVGRVWGVEADGTARNVVGTAEERRAEASTSVAVDAMVDESPGKKSFHQIIEEEEREKKERDEYGDSVWFVSRKPRSTSFEGIVQQQRREERVAEEAREREIDDEMLRLALEISMQEAQPGQAASSTSNGKGNKSTRVRSSPPGGQTVGRGARRKKAEKPLDKVKESRKPRTGGGHSANSATAAKNKTEPRRGDPETRRHAPDSGSRRRRPKPHHDPRCGTAVNQATRQDREEVKLGTSAP